MRFLWGWQDFFVEGGGMCCECAYHARERRDASAGPWMTIVYLSCTAGGTAHIQGTIKSAPVSRSFSPHLSSCLGLSCRAVNVSPA